MQCQFCGRTVWTTSHTGGLRPATVGVQDLNTGILVDDEWVPFLIRCGCHITFGCNNSMCSDCATEWIPSGIPGWDDPDLRHVCPRCHKVGVDDIALALMDDVGPRARDGLRVIHDEYGWRELEYYLYLMYYSTTADWDMVPILRREITHKAARLLTRVIRGRAVPAHIQRRRPLQQQQQVQPQRVLPLTEEEVHRMLVIEETMNREVEAEGEERLIAQHQLQAILAEEAAEEIRAESIEEDRRLSGFLNQLDAAMQEADDAEVDSLHAFVLSRPAS